MRLQDAILAVAQQPGSTRARADLAMMLQQFNVPHYDTVWEAAARVAAARGDFFDALSICRLHMPGERQNIFIDEVVKAYMHAPPSRATRPVAPKPRNALQLPKDTKLLIQLGVQLGKEVSDVDITNFVSMPDIPIFGDLPEPLLSVLAKNMVPVPLQRGELLIKQGTRDRSCFLVTQGRMRVVQERSDGGQVELAQLDAPAVMGEISLLTANSRRASVVAETLLMAWKIDAHLLSQLGGMHPSLIPQIRTLIRMRLVSNLMRSNRLFAELGEKERMRFLQTFTMHTADVGAEIVREGVPSSGLFILMHGKGTVSVQGRGVIGELNEGDVFGAPSFFRSEPSKVTIAVPEGGLLLQLSKQAYQKLLQSFPHLDQTLRELQLMRY
ncbi:MAG: hypothetical protein CL920_03385 [Deltaproteobacteria bacterium]|nr:hypothetical protein [Deltaproteobacteria bacterium]|tara:strand:- start:101 stop:1252 length:1152 start_codon:yes stop_codon:yes gene_type:complete